MNELFESVTAAPAITILCFMAAQGYKAFAPEKMYRHIPALCGLLGLVLGIACQLLIPGYLPAENIVSAAAVGAVSGWAATGIHQVKNSMGRNGHVPETNPARQQNDGERVIFERGI